MENIKMLESLIHELGGMDLLIYNAGYGEASRLLIYRLKATVDINVVGFWR
jgi:short-subunit dehydrogenase